MGLLTQALSGLNNGGDQQQPPAPLGSATVMKVTTSSGKQYSLNGNQINWIQSRYKQDGASTYGWDDADQYARKTGQLSAKMRSTYGNSNVDRQLAELGLPSEKNLEKYLGQYQSWHTGGISDYFGKDVPQDFYTKTKDMFKGDWQYDDTQEDQLRKSSGQMPSKLAAKYTDTEIDDELRAAGLPPVAEMGKYIGRYNNYSAIDNLYKNAAVAWANLGISQDDNGQYIKNDNKLYTVNGLTRKGKDLYADAFYDEMGRKDANGNDVYGSIYGLFKNNHLEEDPDDYDGTNYNQYRGKQFANAAKVADLADDYAAYTAFSYDDFAGKYGDYYDKYLKSYKFSDGQTLEERMKGIAIKNDEQAQREFYDVSDKWFDKGRGTSDFVARYKQMYPNNTYEQMFMDMFENGVPESTVRKTMTTLRNDTSVTGGKNWADDKMSGFKDLTNAYANARQNFKSKQRVNEEAIAAEADELTSEDAVRRIEDYMSESGGWTAENATKAMDALVEAGVDAGTIKDAVADMRARFGDSEYKDAMDALGAYELKEEGPEVFDEFSVAKYQKELNAYKKDAMRRDGEDMATIETAYDAIDRTLKNIVDPDDGVVSVNDVIAVLDSIESASWNNPVAMEKALEEYGFSGFGQFTGLADKLTKNWSKEDKLKLSYAIGSTRVVDAEAESNDFTDKLSDIFGWGDWLKSGEAPITKRSMMYNDFSYALDWAEEQIANGTLTKAQAYQVLSAEGYSPELEQYVGRDWHEAVYKELMVPQLVQQAGGAQLATWEEMTPEEQQTMATSMFNNLTDEEYAAMFGDADWWKSNRNVYRTFGQAFEQQFAALLPTLATDLITSTVELGDMIGAAFTGRPELDDNTQKWMEAQQFVQNYGSVNDDVNGVKAADVMASAAGEILRMQLLGIVGAGAGEAFEATKLGGKLAKLAAGNPGIVKKATGMALSLVRSSPFVANAWAHDYAELKSLGASNSEAMWNSMITGVAEGVLEGFNFDNLWGKVLGQEAFATEILDAGKNFFKVSGIVWKARIANMAASGLGEFTEESIGYVLDTYLKMRHSDTWGKGTEWSAEDWLAQAGMGFLVGAIGGGMSSMDINASRIISEYAMSSEEGLRAVFPDVFVSDGIWDTASETVKASYRTGGATVLSDAAYKTLREQAEACVASAQKTLETARADEADAQEKINNAESEVRKLEDKLAPYMLVKGRKESLTGEEAKEFGSLYAKWTEAKRHAESVRNEVMKDLAEKAGEHERSLQNAESQLKDLQKKIQEHFCGIYLMNEGATPEQAFENMMNAYQNGFKVEGKAAQAVLLDEQAQETQAGTASQEEAAGNNSTTENGNEEPAPISGSSARVAARELAYNRVYKDADAGKAYANAEDIGSESGEAVTPLAFVGKELNGFKAKTTAKIGNVTVEFSEFTPTEKMTSKEIIEAAKQSMTEEAAKKLDALISLGKALGVPMVVRDVVAGLSGYAYDGKIYVTLNGSHSVLRTVSHELTHWMRNTSNYSVLRNHLISDVGGEESFNEMVNKKAEEYGIDLSTDDGRSRADDEVCAELCEKMFENKDALEKFVNEAPEAAKTLKARLAKTLVAIKQAIKSLGTSSSETRGDLIKDQDTIELWYKTLSEAIDAANAEAKGKVQPTIEDVATETSTEAQPQAPPAPEGVEELGISSEEVRKQNLRSELEELAKKGTKVKDFDRASVNEILDRVIVGDRTNYSKADYAQIRGMLAQLIPEIKAMVDGDTSVDLDALNERVQTALNYMLDRYSEPSAELYDLREIIPGRIALTETAYNELRKNSQMTLRGASNRMTRALGKFVNFVYKGSPNYSAASTIDEVWRDIGYEPNGQGNIAEDADALIKYVEDRAKRSSYDDLYGSQREDMVSAHAGEFLDAVQSAVEGRGAETAALHSIDDDYMPLAEKYDAGIATDAEIDEMQREVEEAASAAGFPAVQYDPVIYDENGEIVPLSERFAPDFTGNRYTVDDDWDEAVRRYGAKPQGMNPRARDVQVPERLNRQSRLSDFLRSLVESGKVTAEQVEMIKKMVVDRNYMSYIPTSVADRMEQAQKYIAQRQPLQAQQEFHDMVTEGKGGANTVALGIQLLSDAAERGDIESVLDTAADLQILATDSGQSVQAFSVLKQLKGVGSAWYMQKLVDRLNSKYADRIAAGKMDTITVSPELMAQLASATNVKDIEAAEEAVAKEIAGQLPLTWTDRLSNWRYFSMLANPVTHFRNIFGNVLMGGMNMAKDVVATGLEHTLNVAEEDRAHAVLTAEDRKTWGDWAQKSYDENARNLRGGGKLGFETFVKQNMRSFDTKFLNALAKFNFDKLEGEDIRFIRPAYKNALMQYMKAQGYTLNAKGEVGKYAADGTFTPISNAKMTEAEEWASNQAWKATFRDASDLATMLNKVSKMNSVSRLLVEGVMPFKKTPINIAKRGIEYSPAGIVMGIAQLTNGVKKGKYTPAQAIDTLASGLTGSALMALGVFLAKLGVIRGGGEDKKKYETYLEDTGDQTYAFKIGDVSINMSSIAPATIPLFMGVALEEMLNRQGDSFDLSTFTDTIAGTLNPLMEMSFMSSLNSALQNYNNNGIGGALGNTVLTAAQNYGSQYLPTAVARLGQLADPVQRTTKSSATSPIGGNMDYYVRSLAKKVPGATTALEPDVNVWGQTNTKDTFGEWLLDVANKFVLPTNVKITNRDAVDKELIRLVESTGGVDFLPSDGNKYFTVSGQTYKMNARQYTEFSKERGEASYAAIKEVMNSPAYVNANDTQRADMLEKALKAAQKQVNTNWKYKLGAFD